MLTPFLHSIRERDGYEAEKARFEKVLQNASDEERFLMLRFAMYHHFVPEFDSDPYFYIYSHVTHWHRTKMIYSSLLNRTDLLQQLNPNLEELGKYVRSYGYGYALDYNNDSTILKQMEKYDTLLAKDSALFNSMRDPNNRLYKKYFDTPLLKYR